MDQSNAILAQLSDSTLESIKSQIGWLENMHEKEMDPSQKERMSAMVDGAKTVFYILDTDPISERGTDKWLKKLDMDQLRYAKQKIESLIKAKEDEDRILIWGCCSEFSPSYWFMTYEEAANKLIDVVKKDMDDKKPRHHKFHIDSIRVIESELKDYIDV